MCSQRVWAIEELVHLICSHTLEYKGKSHRQKDGDIAIYSHLVFNPKSRMTLARCATLNRSISRIATKVLWRVFGPCMPCFLGVTIPIDQNIYNRHTRGQAGERVLTVSIHAEPFDGQWLRFLIRSSTPPENQPSASASTLRFLHIYRNSRGSRLSEENEGLARDLIAFQRSNGKLGGGLETFRDIPTFPFRGYSLFHTGFAYQESIENAVALPPPEATDSPAHRLRRLKVTHGLNELPAFFGRVAKMRGLERLKIAIAIACGNGGTLEAEEGAQHSVSSLEMEGRWSELFSAINLCPPPSTAAQLQTLRLYYYEQDLPRTQVEVAHLLDLPARIIPPDHLETLAIELLSRRDNGVPVGKELAHTVDAFRPLLRYRRMVTLHLDLPWNNLLDIEFLYALAAVMGGTLRHLVVLRATTRYIDERASPVLTVDDLPTIAGVILPRLETPGLDVIWDEKLLSAKRHSLVVSPLLRTLYVGARDPLCRPLGQVDSSRGTSQVCNTCTIM